MGMQQDELQAAQGALQDFGGRGRFDFGIGQAVPISQTRKRNWYEIRNFLQDVAFKQESQTNRMDACDDRDRGNLLFLRMR